MATAEEIKKQLSSILDINKSTALLEAVNEVIIPGAKEIVPVDTGWLRDHIFAREASPNDTGWLNENVLSSTRNIGENVQRIEGASATVEVVASTGLDGHDEYASAVEMGTSKQSAQPYLLPTIDERQDQLLRAVASKIQAQMRANNK